jgi:hypothetical protein
MSLVADPMARKRRSDVDSVVDELCVRFSLSLEERSGQRMNECMPCAVQIWIGWVVD